MSHDDAFAALRERKRTEEAERDAGRVTWRRIDRFQDDGQGLSGIGSGGRLVYVVPHGPVFAYGRVVDGVRRHAGYAMTVEAAKTHAADLLRGER